MKNSKQSIEQRVKNLISDKLAIDLDLVTDEADLRNNLGADSLDTVEVIMELEKEFDIIITDDEAEELTTVKHHVDIVERLSAEEIKVNLDNENVTENAK